MAFSFVVVGVVVAVGVGVVVAVAVAVAVVGAVGVVVGVGVKDVNNERRRDNCAWPAVLRCGLSGREDVEMIAWTDEAIEAANALLNREWAAGIPDDLLRRALDAAVTAQEAREFPGFKEWALEGEYHRGRAEALEEAARVAETTAESDLAYGRRYRDEYHKMEQRAHRGRTIAAAIRALKEKQG